MSKKHKGFTVKGVSEHEVKRKGKKGKKGKKSSKKSSKK